MWYRAQTIAQNSSGAKRGQVDSAGGWFISVKKPAFVLRIMECVWHVGGCWCNMAGSITENTPHQDGLKWLPMSFSPKHTAGSCRPLNKMSLIKEFLKSAIGTLKRRDLANSWVLRTRFRENWHILKAGAFKRIGTEFTYCCNKRGNYANPCLHAALGMQRH